MATDPQLVSFLAGRDVACPGCGYNLRGLGEAICPECGKLIEINALTARKRFSWWKWLSLTIHILNLLTIGLLLFVGASFGIDMFSSDPFGGPWSGPYPESYARGVLQGYVGAIASLFVGWLVFRFGLRAIRRHSWLVIALNPYVIGNALFAFAVTAGEAIWSWL